MKDRGGCRTSSWLGSRPIHGCAGTRGRGLSVALGLLLAACQSGDELSDPPGRVVISAADVQVVGAPGALARIVDMEAAGDGRIWVLNSVEPFFVVLGTDGQVHRSFGRRGGGPAEFEDPIELVRGPDGRIWTFDNLRRAIRPLSDEQTPDVALPPNWRVVSFENAGMGMVATAPWVQSQGRDMLVARKRPSAPPSGGLGTWHADIYRVGVDSVGLEWEQGVAVPDLLGDPGERYPGASILVPFPIWAACGDGTLVLYDPLANTIRRLASDGGEGSSIPLGVARNEPVDFRPRFRDGVPAVLRSASRWSGPG